MSRTTMKDLQHSLALILRMTGRPAMSWTPRKDVGSACPVGAYYIEKGSSTYGYWWKLVQTCNEGGGITTVLSAPTAAGLQIALRAWIAGYEQATQDNK